MGIGAYRHRVTLRQPSDPPVVAGAASSSRWRLQFSATNDPDGYVGVRELSLAATVGGPDQCQGGTATASSEYLPFNPAGKAFDDDVPDWSYWSSATQVLPEWLQYAFDAPVAVGEYRLRVEGDEPGVAAYYAPNSWTLEYWDGAAWIVADTQSNQAEWMGGETRTFAVVPVVTPVVWDCSVQSVATAVVDGLAAFYIRGRFHPDITLETQLLFEGRTFQVQAITDVDERHVEQQLYCVEVVGRHGSVHA